MTKCDTKWYLLRTSARVFYPLELIAAVVLRVKSMFQKLWGKLIYRDEELPEDVQTECSDWCSDLPQIGSTTFLHCYTRGDYDKTTYELHLFWDASPKAYGAAAYLRTVADFGITSNLIMSKSRVAPHKKISLPRFELMAAVLPSRLCNLLSRVFE